MYRDAATHEALAEKFRGSKLADPMARFPKAEARGTDPSVTHKAANLVETSDIISFNGTTTLVPKRALIQIPPKFADRINNHPEGAAVLSWADFYAHNRGWITTVEVKRVQAQGKERIDAEVLEQMGKSSNLIVAVYKGGPISLLPLKDQAKNETANQQPQP